MTEERYRRMYRHKLLPEYQQKWDAHFAMKKLRTHEWRGLTTELMEAQQETLDIYSTLLLVIAIVVIILIYSIHTE